jgi:hypothetical protein
MEAPFNTPDLVHNIGVLTLLMRTAVNTVPTPRSSTSTPTDNVNHWVKWYRGNRVRPPTGAIREFVLLIRQQQLANVEQPRSGAEVSQGSRSQTSSDASGSGGSSINPPGAGVPQPPDQDGSAGAV